MSSASGLSLQSLARLALRRLVGVRREMRASPSLRVWLLYRPGPGPALMSWLRRRWVVFRNPHARVEFGGGVYLGPGFSLDMPHGGTFIAGPGAEFRRGFRAELGGPQARITIGARAVFTYDVVIQCSSSIDIGTDCVFAQATMIVDGSHRFQSLDQPMLEQGYALRPLRIHDHATVMSKSTVIADIGERTFVGAGAVVTRPLPPYCVAVGVPARVIDYFGPPGGKPPRSAKAETAG